MKPVPSPYVGVSTSPDKDSGVPLSASFQFRLYVADDTQNSALAIANLTELCQKYLPGLHEFEIVDVLLEPGRALADGVAVTPTLVKVTPAPSCRIIGTLGHTQMVLKALGLETMVQ